MDLLGFTCISEDLNKFTNICPRIYVSDYALVKELSRFSPKEYVFNLFTTLAKIQPSLKLFVPLGFACSLQQ